MNKYQQKGLTLIELMVVIAILAILVSIAAPSFSGVRRSTELRSTLADLSSILAFARNTAVTRYSQVTLCSSADGQTCSGAADWSTGWIVFEDINEDGKLTTGDCNPTSSCLIRVEEKTSVQYAINGDSTWIAFDEKGALNTTGGESLCVHPLDSVALSNLDYSAQINLSPAGSKRTQRGVKCI